ncbi:MAG: hypothetical protein VKM98_06360 [Cyanobacteriota bacterium]|nr:hypothetical protein [Cyanobacteriota bacterium]
MKFLFSALAAAVALLGANGEMAAQASAMQLQPPPSRERLQLARSRMQQHQRAMDLGDPSRSPYYRCRGPEGPSAAKQGEQEWIRELTASC